eukprot:TRINITY_DN16585_c0_g2_i1.p1 TRINITY_DN16585_c0_g2~~TRINITY_DN16585_c0_g2_i1.p1  ORF type:complete len:330 (+),score=54.59 TRINITY_DN16585_c0_g2_i1:42-992(+)
MAAFLASVFNKTTGTVCGAVRWAFFPKNVDPGEFYKKNKFTDTEADAAQEYLEWCSFAYKDEADIPEGWKLIDIKGDDTQAIVGKSRDGKTAIVAFRGTESTRDCLKDVSIHLSSSEYFPGKVHFGFLNGHLKSYDAVTKEFLSIIDSNTTRSVVTGHSLGGALATLYSYRIHKDEQFLKKQKDLGKDLQFDIASFGSPRVGDFDFCNAYDESIGNRYLRWVHETDIVTRYPLTGMGIIIPNYYHCGIQHYMSTHNDVYVATKTGCKKSTLFFCAEWLDNASAHSIFTSFVDHKCCSYKKGIEACRLTANPDTQSA